MRKPLYYFLLSLGVALLLTFLIKEPSFNDSQVYVLFLLLFSIGLWLTEAIPPFSTGLFILAYLVFALGNPRFNSEPQDIARYVNTFSSSVIWLMLGGFFLAAALTKTRLDADLFKFTLKISGTTPRRILMGLMLTTMTASMLMSNTATTAMVIAACMPLLKNLGKQSPLTKALLIGIPLSAALGGMATIIGSPPNAIAAGALENAGIKVDFMKWMLYGLPLSIVLTAISYLALTRLFIKDNQPLSFAFLQTEEGHATDRLHVERRIVIVVIAVTLLLWMTSSLHNVSVSAVSAIPIVFLTMTRVLDGNDVRGLSWDTLLLVAGGLSLGLALQETGLLNFYAARITEMAIPELLFLGTFAFVTMLFSNIMSNTATSTVLIPLGMAVLPQLKLEASMIIGLAASTALFLPVSTPPNAIAYSTGLMEQKDFRIGGILIGLLGPTAVVLWVLFVT